MESPSVTKLHFRLSLASLASLSLLIAACDAPGATPGAYAQGFETSDDFFTLMDGLKPGASPHGSVQIWYSTSLREAILGGATSFEAPEGSVAIKRGGDDGMDGMETITVMIKRNADYDPDNGNWEYEMRDGVGALMNDQEGQPMSGPIEMCIGCHAAASATDYLAGTSLR